VPLSTSSSEPAPVSRVVPAGGWGWAVSTALLIMLIFIGAMELRLALRGYVATIKDSPTLWAAQRARASRLGAKALILVGGSRIQLAADMDELRRKTGLEPVQLAIDGSNFLPVLADLAADPAVRGMVLVDMSDHQLLGVRPDDYAHAYVREYQRRRTEGNSLLITFADAEPWLENLLDSRLRSYADGARPLSTLWSRLVVGNPVPQYMVMRRDRSRLADYSRVRMPEFYFTRVMRNMNEQVPVNSGMTWEDLDHELRRRIEAIAPMTESQQQYLSGATMLAGLAARIRAHGGSVQFLMLPSSKLVRLIEKKRYPRAVFWDRFAETVSAPTLHFEDVPTLRAFACPDGSHLDYRDRARFTAALVNALGMSALP